MSEKTHHAKKYQGIKRRVSFSSLGVTVAVLFLFVLTPASVLLRNVSESFASNVWLIVGMYFTLFSLIFLLFDLPFSYYSGFVLEHRYGLSNLSLGGWIRETVKRQLIGFIFAIVLIELLYAIIRRWDEHWWLVAWLAWCVVTIVMGKLWPVLIAPLFYKYTLLNNSELRERIMALLGKVGLRIEDVYSMDLSKTTKKANAYFCGLGNTRRVVLSDTLIRNFSTDEMAVVVAHEAGHCKLGHIWRGMIFSSIISMASFWLGYYVLTKAAPLLDMRGASDIASFPLLGLVAMIFGLLLMPFSHGFSRRMEREADDFALRATKMKEVFIVTMQKLALLNLSDPDPHPAIEFFFYSHPSIKKRIERAKSFSAYA